MRFRLHTLMLMPAILAIALVVFASVPRTTTVLHNEHWTAKYTGLDWIEGKSIFGRRYYEFAVDDLPRRSWLIHYSGGECANAVARYPDGTIALSGRCRIERTESQAYPLIDDLSDAVSYTPTGTIAARVTNGTGKAILFHPNGTKNWEMSYDGFKRTEWLLFDENGNLLSSSHGPKATQRDG